MITLKSSDLESFFLNEITMCVCVCTFPFLDQPISILPWQNAYGTRISRLACDHCPGSNPKLRLHRSSACSSRLRSWNLQHILNSADSLNGGGQWSENGMKNSATSVGLCRLRPAPWSASASRLMRSARHAVGELKMQKLAFLTAAGSAGRWITGMGNGTEVGESLQLISNICSEYLVSLLWWKLFHMLLSFVSTPASFIFFYRMVQLDQNLDQHLSLGESFL